MRVVAIPFASEVHGREYYSNIMNYFKKYLEKYPDVVIHEEFVVSNEDISKVAERYRDYLPIAIVLTGGTSSLIHKFFNNGDFKRIFLLAHSEHNSLASAVSARSKIEDEGFSAGLYWCEDPSSSLCEENIDYMMRIVNGVSALYRSRILVITDREKGDIENAFESRFDSEVHIMPINKLLDYMNSISTDEVREVAREIESKYVFTVSTKDLDKIARLYLSLEKLSRERYSVVSIDCFPYIMKTKTTPCIPLSLLNSKGVVATCEADLTVIPSMILARRLSGRSGWIGNIVSVKNKQIMFSHCTISLDIVRGKASALPHFETLNPYAVTGELDGDKVTIVSIDKEFSTMMIDRGVVIKSGLLTDKTCRTQVIIELESSATHIPRTAPTNHHVIILGDHVNELREIAAMFNISVFTYKELQQI